MRATRSIVHSWSSFARLLMAVAVSLAVIVGLLAMHTLSTADSAHGSRHAEVATEAHGTAQMPIAGQSADAGPQPCDCVEPAPAPAHSMLLMSCVLALLVVLLLLAPPSLVGTLGALRSIGTGVARAHGALARPQPPSLLVLSISRT